MAKAYITGNKRKGSVGGETYSVVKGQCIVKSKPVQVANPRTAAQMTQRSLFIDAVRFFQHSNQNYFKLAFEDKKTVESDYNAFMRTNAKLGVNITKALSSDPQWPAIGNFVVAKGSLNSAQLSYASSKYNLAVSGASASTTTIGALSTLLKTAYGLNESDIVTIVTLDSALTAISSDTCEPTYNGTAAPSWSIVQFKINSTSTATIASVLGSGFACVANALQWSDPNAETASSAFVVFSRNTSTGLKVSTQSMVNNTITAGIITTMKTDAFVEKVLATWDISSDAILQGGLA